VRLARVATGRTRVVACGYHGWLDGATSGAGVPLETASLWQQVPFNDVPALEQALKEGAPAAIVLEPVVERAPSLPWLRAARQLADSARAVLVFDEIKTAFRLAIGGATERYGVVPDLVVIGKALANGLPLAAVGGRAEVMAAVTRTWISSTLATESVSLTAALATLDVFERESVCPYLHRIGTRLLHGLHRLQHHHRDHITGVAGVAEMIFLNYANDDVSRAVATGCARRGVLFKRTAYNFVSLAHSEADVDRTLAVLEEVLQDVARAT